MGAMQRRKGHNFERELVKLFREAMPGAHIRRGLQTREGTEVADVECPVFWIEAKRGKKPNVRAALKQAIEQAPKGRIPTAIVKDDRAQGFAVMQLDDFLDLVREWWSNSKL